MDFDTAFNAISKLNKKYQCKLDELKSGPHSKCTVNESIDFMCAFDKDYEEYWNNDFDYFSQDERKFLNKLLDEAGELKMQIYFEMENKKI